MIERMSLLVTYRWRLVDSQRSMVHSKKQVSYGLWTMDYELFIAHRLPLTVVALLFTLCTSCSYNRERGREATATDPKNEATDVAAASPTPAPVAYDVLLENSGSMDGYVQGVTAFKDDIYQLLVDIGYLADTLSLFYINSQPIPYTSGTEKFINHLEPAEFQQRGGNRSNSDLNQIFGELLRRTSDQRAGLLISDFILSLGQGNTQDLLNNQRISVYNTFRGRLEAAPFATYIVKMYSDFTGNYYTKDDRPVYLRGVRRPYYLWFTGPAATLQSLPAALKIEQLPGYAHSYILLPGATPDADAAETPFYTVLNNTYKQGSFRTHRASAGRGSSGQPYVHGIENARASQRGNRDADQASGAFGFSVAVDMSGIAADVSYLLDPDNYQVSGYQLDTVMVVGQTNALHPRDQSMVAGATHVLVFSTIGTNYTNLQVALKKRTPAWVQQTSSDDDSTIKNDEAAHDQTFGFRYLVAGVEEGYWNVFGRDPYFTLEVSVTR